ncbi:MAG: agmatine deiminase family protein, partial [Solirubrobacteraceae bacterium]
GCLMAWPTRRELWAGMIDVAEREYAGVANAIAAFERVVMVVAPGTGLRARRLLGSEVELVELPLDDSWLRDAGPIFVRSGDGARAGVDFRFNSWGERFLPYGEDARVSAGVLEHLGIQRVASEMVLEGGSITVDGQGTLITTEQCLLNPNRNALMTREEIEAELRGRLGVRTIVWLPFGHAEDAHTDGHVDGVCGFIRPGVVIVQSCEDPAHPDYARMRANRAVLNTARDDRGRALEIIEVPLYPYTELGGHRTSVSYVNFYIANGGVIVPLAETAMDRCALEIIEAALPDHRVVGVPARCVAFGGGGVHCITQQIPSAAANGV